MANPVRRWYLWLLPLLLAGACQRATYLFQAPAATLAAARLPAGPVAASDTLAAARVPALAPAARLRHPARRRTTAQARRPYSAGLARLATRPLARPARQRPAAQAAPGQEPLPPGRTRSRGVALLLAAIPALLGLPLGLHNFYLGYTGRGIVSLLLFLTAVIFISIGIAYFFVGLFFGAASTQAVLFLIGIAIQAGLTVWHLIDAILIATGNLLPRNGVYKPKFF